MLLSGHHTIQMHGTGTPLGDPVEMGAICSTFAQHLRSGIVSVSAAKSTYAHSEAAAGLVGLHQTICAMNERTQPYLLLRSLNPHVQLGHSASGGFIIPREPAPAGLASSAGVSAFAFQGTNAHVVLCSNQVSTTMRASHSRPLERMHWWFGPQYDYEIPSVVRCTQASLCFQFTLSAHCDHHRRWRQLSASR